MVKLGWQGNKVECVWAHLSQMWHQEPVRINILPWSVYSKPKAMETHRGPSLFTEWVDTMDYILSSCHVLKEENGGIMIECSVNLPTALTFSEVRSIPPYQKPSTCLVCSYFNKNINSLICYAEHLGNMTIEL